MAGTRVEEIENTKFRITAGPRIASPDIVQLLKDQAAEIDKLRASYRELAGHHNEKCSCSDIF